MSYLILFFGQSSLGNFSFKARLIAFALTVSALALLLSLTFGLWSGYVEARSQRAANLSSLSRTLAYSLQAPIAFEDKGAAHSVMESLRFTKPVVYAVVWGPDKNLLVEYERAKDIRHDYYRLIAGSKVDDVDSAEYGEILVTESIELDGERLGSLVTIATVDDLKEDLVEASWRFFVVLALCLLVAYLFASLLQRHITRPIFHLLGFMKLIEHEKRYDKRLPITGDDEFSLLMKSFNSMLSEIERRDEGLAGEVRRQTEEIRTALKAAEAANVAKSQFLANMSHELRTPLNGVVGMISLLQDVELADDQRELVHLLASSADTLLSVINDILDFSKIEQGKLEIEDRQFHLPEMWATVEQILKFQAEEKGILYVSNFMLPPNLDFRGDELRVRQVLLNLINNALKFTSGGGAIIVSTWLEEVGTNHGRLHFAVSDTGIGIEQKKLSLIFNPFTQADGTTTRRFGGTGLGLSISRQLVELMRGQISVKSRESIGSCFSFYVTVGLVKSTLTQSSEYVAAPGVPRTESLRILVAEDNKVNQRLAQRLLEAESHTVAIAQNGAEAVELARTEAFDLILMDIQMPVMDGMEATRVIRSLSGEYSKVPIVGLSAHAFREVQERSVSSGMNGYVTKPFKKADLLAAIAKVLE